MNCLLCHRKLALTLKFHELFLLRNESPALCEKCEKSFIKIDEKHCPRCWKEGEISICQDCLAWEEKGMMIEHQAYFCYQETMKEYFSNYKFQGDYALRFAFANTFKKMNYKKDEVIVPIPLSEARLLERGFNQVTGFLEAGNIPYENLLNKADTVKQSSLTRSERLKTKNVFTIVEDVKLPKKVILIDDIYTTGTTLVHAKQTLLEAGVLNVRSFSLCH